MKQIHEQLLYLHKNNSIESLYRRRPIAKIYRASAYSSISFLQAAIYQIQMPNCLRNLFRKCHSRNYHYFPTFRNLVGFRSDTNATSTLLLRFANANSSTFCNAYGTTDVRNFPMISFLKTLLSKRKRFTFNNYTRVKQKSENDIIT